MPSSRKTAASAGTPIFPLLPAHTSLFVPKLDRLVLPSAGRSAERTAIGHIGLRLGRSGTATTDERKGLASAAQNSEHRDRGDGTRAASRPGVGGSPDVTRVLVARSLRAFGDGYVAILLPVHLSRLGYDAFAVGLISTATLLGSALLTLAVGLLAHRIARRRALLGRGPPYGPDRLGFRRGHSTASGR